MKEIYADFNARTEAGLVRLSTVGSIASIAGQGVALGEKVLLRDEELSVMAVIAQIDPMLAIPDWTTQVGKRMTPFALSIQLLLQLHALIDQDRDEGDEGDLLRDKMDGPWELLNDEERDLVKHVSGALNDERERNQRPKPSDHVMAQQAVTNLKIVCQVCGREQLVQKKDPVVIEQRAERQRLRWFVALDKDGKVLKTVCGGSADDNDPGDACLRKVSPIDGSVELYLFIPGWTSEVPDGANVVEVGP